MTVEIDSSAIDPVIVMTHTLEAPRALVWTAFTTPEHVMNWYGGRGFSNPVCEMDVRPGGRWRHVMRTPDGREHRLEFVFVEVVEPERLSWQSERGLHGEPGALNTVTFVARFASRAERDLAMSWGFTRVLGEGVDRMVAVLAGLMPGANEKE
jgi:uncharacterized protein YndB with AHSA1/START domain